MKKIIFILLLLLPIVSCSNLYLIKYQIVGTATNARIEYMNNGVSVSEEIEIPYVKEIFLDSNRQIGIHIYNIVGGVAECNVLFIHNSGWQLYGTKESDYEIIIKGRLNSLL
jgi:hypothetical protein